MINAGCWRADCDVLIHDGMKDKCSNRMKIVQPSPAQQQPQNWKYITILQYLDHNAITNDITIADCVAFRKGMNTKLNQVRIKIFFIPYCFSTSIMAGLCFTADDFSPTMLSL